MRVSIRSFPGLSPPATFPIRFQDVAPVGEPVQQGAGERLEAKAYALG